MTPEERDSLIWQSAGGHMALEQFLLSLLTIAARAHPELRPLFIRAVDDAANRCERLSVEHGESARHFAIAFKLLQQIRPALEDEKSKPRAH